MEKFFIPIIDIHSEFRQFSKFPKFHFSKCPISAYGETGATPAASPAAYGREGVDAFARLQRQSKYDEQ